MPDRVFHTPPTPAPAETVAIGIGSNIGDTAAHLRFAVQSVRALPTTTLLAVADPITTEPVGPIAQPPFLNSCILIATSLSARALLAHLHDIERSRGRDRAREQRWGPRTLDLDILLFGIQTISEPGLTIPHPRLCERRFALEPLAQIAPTAQIPTIGLTVREALARLTIR